MFLNGEKIITSVENFDKQLVEKINFILNNIKLTSSENAPNWNNMEYFKINTLNLEKDIILPQHPQMMNNNNNNNIK